MELIDLQVRPCQSLSAKSAQFLESGFDVSPAAFAGAAIRAICRVQSEQG
jgi:hypothetical protein